MFANIFKLFRKEESSKDLAKERLKLVLIHDKANVSPQFLEMVKGEIIKVIKKYMEIDENLLEIQLTKTKSDEGDRIVPALIANIPILNVKALENPKKNIANEDLEEETEKLKEEKSESVEKKNKTENKSKTKKNSARKATTKDN